MVKACAGRGEPVEVRRTVRGPAVAAKHGLTNVISHYENYVGLPGRGLIGKRIRKARAAGHGKRSATQTHGF